MDDILANLSKDDLVNLIHVFDIQIAVVLVLIVLVTKSFFAKIVLKIMDTILKRKKKPEESGMYKPLQFMYVFLGVYLAVKILPFGNKISILMTALMKSAIIIFVANIINSTVLDKDSKIFKKNNGKKSSETVTNLICKLLKIVVWVVAIYIIIAGVLGFTQINGLVTGLGLGTVVISFAAQDTVKSLFSGFTILTDKPFVIGDWIEVGNYAGSVIDITFRSTRIRCSDNSIVTIPNSTITEEFVINWNKLKTRRFECVLNLEMNIEPDKIKNLIKELKVVICSKDYVKADTVYIGLNKIADYSLDIKIFMYLTETNYVKFLKLQEDLNYEFLKVLAKENVALAYPTETVHVKNI
ncbi:MAG: mechanosensitive ion channel family protein [Clostridia bacterium]|nr:mechanosensitive ion channel family protein [Clostridia bacterium]